MGAGAGAGAGTDAGGSGEFAAQASVARANIAQLLANINTVQRLSSALGGTKDTVSYRTPSSSVPLGFRLLVSSPPPKYHM